MPLSREQAIALLYDWTQTEALRRHALAVEYVMAKAAHRYGSVEDELTFRLAGLLHDADYEQWPETHPDKIVCWLEAQGEQDLAHAISAHHTRWGKAYRSSLDKALLACDELTGFVMACCLVRPGGISTLEPKSVKKKLKDKAFAAKVDRAEIQAGVAMLQVPLEDHIALVIDALRPHAELLGLTGSA